MPSARGRRGGQSNTRRQQPNEERGVTNAEEEARRMRQIAGMVADRQEQLTSLLAGQVDVDRFITVALQAVQTQPKLLKCTPLSILSAIRDAATYGLEPAGILGDAAIVPYESVATLQIEYRGLRKLALRDGKVAAIDADVVYDADEFAIISGSDPKVHHVPALKDRGNIRLAYAWARFGNGELVVLWMDLEELYQRRNVSKAFRYAEKDGSNDSTWHKWPAEMMKKTVLKRLISEKLPLTPVAREALAQDTEADIGEPRVRAVNPSRNGDARERVLSRLGLGEKPQLGAGQDPAADPGAAGQDAAQSGRPDADSGSAASAAPGRSVGVEPSQQGSGPAAEEPVTLCGAPSPYPIAEGDTPATCKKPAGHETLDEPGAKMHRSSARETWE